MVSDYQVEGQNASALFTLKIFRGDGMCLLGMNWKKGKPPANFVGFAIEYKEPGAEKYFALKNRLCFPFDAKSTDPNHLSTLRSPIQKFRWVHFPRNANLPGPFSYRVTPVFMNQANELSYGEPQTADIELARETYPGELNVAFTRGFVSSQAFVERYKTVTGLFPTDATKGLTFKPTHKQATAAYEWMGFEAYKSMLEVLDAAIADTKAKVRFVAYDLNEPEIVNRIMKLKTRVKIIIDNHSTDHGKKGSAENQAEVKLDKSAGKHNVLRQHMGNIQHNKFIAVMGPKAKLAVCGSTNFSWRAFFVQNNNAVILQGKDAVQPFFDAFDNYWQHTDDVKGFSATQSARWTSLNLKNVNAKVAFSPHIAANALLQDIGDDIEKSTSSLLYSLAFLAQTGGAVRDALKKVSNNNKIFVYGISDRKAGGIVVHKPDGNLAPVFPAALTKGLPEPFKSEPTGGKGVRMHHKFTVIDFDKPTARVYLGSYNFSNPADLKNGENLLLIRDRRIAVSYMVEALSMFDHYHFRVVQQAAKKKKKRLDLALPPIGKQKAWFEEDWTDHVKIRDRELFS